MEAGDEIMTDVGGVVARGAEPNHVDRSILPSNGHADLWPVRPREAAEQCVERAVLLDQENDVLDVATCELQLRRNLTAAWARVCCRRGDQR